MSYLWFGFDCKLTTVNISLDIYYISFPKDNYKLKLVVSSIYVLEIVQTIISTHDAFRMFSSGWGNLVEVDDIGLLWLGIPVMGVISTC